MNRWQCRRWAPLLVDYVDGTLSPQQTQRLAQHVETCADCAVALQALQEVPSLLQASSPPPISEAMLAEQRTVLRRAIAIAPPPASRWRFDWPAQAWRLPVAACASLVLAFLLVQSFSRGMLERPATWSSLDDATLIEMHDLSHVVSTRDEIIPFISRDAGLVVPFLSDAANAAAAADTLPDDELQGVSDLLQDVS